MSAAALLEHATRQGVTVEVRDGKLKLSGPSWSVHDMTPAIREAKDEILAYLDPPPLSVTDHEAIREAIEERAAIREYEAEDTASVAMQVYRFRLKDRPDAWLTMLAPNCSRDEARHDLETRFGAERLIDVRRHRAESMSAHRDRWQAVGPTDNRDPRP